MLKLSVRGEEEASQGGQLSGDPPATQGSGREEPQGERAQRRALHLQPANGAGCTERAGARHSPHPGHSTALPARPSLRLRESAAGRTARTPPPRRAVTHARYEDVLGKNKPLLIIRKKNHPDKIPEPQPQEPKQFCNRRSANRARRSVAPGLGWGEETGGSGWCTSRGAQPRKEVETPMRYSATRGVVFTMFVLLFKLQS